MVFPEPERYIGVDHFRALRCALDANGSLQSFCQTVGPRTRKWVNDAITDRRIDPVTWAIVNAMANGAEDAVRWCNSDIGVNMALNAAAWSLSVLRHIGCTEQDELEEANFQLRIALENAAPETK